MVSNAEVTLFLPTEHGFQAVRASAFWRFAQRLHTSKASVKEGHPSSVYLPLEENLDLAEVTLSTDWYILRGRAKGVDCSTLTAKELLKLGGKRVVAADLFDYCSPDMRHWKLEVE